MKFILVNFAGGISPIWLGFYFLILCDHAYYVGILIMPAGFALFRWDFPYSVRIFFILVGFLLIMV